MGKALTAFTAGYLAIVLIFASFFAGLWWFQGSGSFAGLPDNPSFPAFVYFSLATATTVGYGDIVARSDIARSVAGLELICSLGWTIIVFAALAAQFASEAVRSRAT